MLLAFFVPGIALSRIGANRKAQLVDIDKRKARDARQVLANGGAAAAAAVAFGLTHSPVAAAACAGGFAAAAADTFGTEIGTIAGGSPRSIIGFRPIARGLSGGVTAAGTAAEVAGALLVAAVASALGIAALWIVVVAGVAGAIADSVTGATLQALRYCSRCQRFCEVDPHVCGAHAPIVRGARVIDNDAVNALATIAGALIAAGLTQIAAF